MTELWTPTTPAARTMARQVLLVARLRHGARPSDLCRVLGVHVETVRKDLRELEAAGVVERTALRGPNVRWRLVDEDELLRALEREAA